MKQNNYLLFREGNSRGMIIKLVFISTCPVGQVASAVHLPECDFHLSRASGQPLVSFHALLQVSMASQMGYL